MQETFKAPWHGSAESLKRDAFGEHVKLALATQNGAAVGFAAWRPTYDLHHCVPGIEVIDLYVEPAHRGRVWHQRFWRSWRPKPAKAARST